jgi:hypothetical protein
MSEACKMFRGGAAEGYQFISDENGGGEKQDASGGQHDGLKQLPANGGMPTLHN